MDAEVAGSAERPEGTPAAAAPAEVPPGGSGSIDVAFSGPVLPAAPVVPDPAAPIAHASELDSAPVSSGRVTSMSVAATGPTEHAGRSHRITEAGKEMLGKGVETLGTGLGSLGEGVTKLGEVSKKVPIVGSSVTRLGEGITSVGESLTDLPRVARTRRGRLLVRSLLVGFLLVFGWIAVIVLIQSRRIDSPDFRPYAERIFTEIGKGKPAIEELYEKSSPRFQELVRKDRFVDEMLDLKATIGDFIEILSVNEILVTRGPTGRVGRISLSLLYSKGETRGSVILHWVDNEWKLLYVSVLLPDDLTITQAEREERVAACKDPMDPRRCEIHAISHGILQQLRDGDAGSVWDKASDIFQKQEQKNRWVQIQAENQQVLGEYRRIIAVTEAKVVGGGVRGSFDVLAEYSNANVRVTFGYIRDSKEQPWKLRMLKIAMPMPRIDDLERASTR